MNDPESQIHAALENPLTTTFHDRNPDPMFGLYSHYPQVRRALCAIDSGTGALTVANGTLLDFETATSHQVTVRVTDLSLATYDESFAINLTNVVENAETIAQHVYDHADIGCLLLCTTHETMLDALIERRFANALRPPMSAGESAAASAG